MTEPTEDVPGESDGDEEYLAAGENEVGPELVPVRGQRRQLVKARISELADWHLAQGEEPGESVEVVFRGNRISSEGGSAEVIGALLQRLSRLFTSITGGEPFVEGLVFGNSVHITLSPSRDELERGRADYERAVELQERRRDEEPMPAAARLLLEDSIPDVEVAATLAADLLTASASEAPAAAVRFGSEVAQAYKALANAVARNEVTVEIDAPHRKTPARLGPEKAARVTEALRQVTEPRTYEIEVFGVLSIADAVQHGFGLRLEPRGRAYPILRGRRLLRGPFTPQVEDAIRERGLWGNRVRARIRVRQDALVSTSTIRPPTFTLVHVEPAA